MAERIIKMRDVLYDALIKLETPGKWDHIKSQIGKSDAPLRLVCRSIRSQLTVIGMFSFTGSKTIPLTIILSIG